LKLPFNSILDIHLVNSSLIGLKWDTFNSILDIPVYVCAGEMC